MLIRRLARARPQTQLHRAAVPGFHRPQRRWLSDEEIADPDMVRKQPYPIARSCTGLTEVNGQNGGYISPPAISRQKRDPYGNWWDKQERRNYGEPVHEDNDILGVFAPERYDFYTAPQVWGLFGCAVACFATLWSVVYLNYPDRITVDRGFEGGLDRELGGRGTMIVSTICSLQQICKTKACHRRGRKMALIRWSMGFCCMYFRILPSEGSNPIFVPILWVKLH